VYPGKKMAGRMGNIQNTVQNLKILKVDAESGIVVVSGMFQATLWLSFLFCPHSWPRC
jgi:large subunit ribosomal protein L3